jgi:protein-disulfide isomerase
MRQLSKVLLAVATIVFPATLVAISPRPQAQEKAVTAEAILNDPQAPVAGNPQGDITIVAFLDYNCPFCKQSAPALEKLVKADGKIRLVYKDWPILTAASMHGAQLALAAKYQGKYEAVHQALMGIPGRRISKEQMTEAAKASGVDVERLRHDLKQHAPEIVSLIQRNLDQADTLGLQGTPVFLVGPFKVASSLDYEGFRKVVAEARAKQKQ